MFYSINSEKVKKIEINQINNENLCFGYITQKEINTTLKFLNINEQLDKEFKTHNNSFYYIENYFINIIDVKDVNNIDKTPSKLGILLEKKLLIFFIIEDDSDFLNKIILNIIDELSTNCTIEQIISTMINKIIFNDYEPIVYFENKIIEIENKLLKNKINDNLKILIFSIKKQLFLSKRYYEYILNFISEIKNIAFEKNNLKQITTLENKITRLIDSTQYLIENTVHLREIYQDSLNFNQNNIIKLLTLITTIFLPQSLITGWYGMNFEYMPEIHSRYSYPIMIVISILISIITLVFLKKKKIL